jgi:large subunit ribosomal protein L4
MKVNLFSIKGEEKGKAQLPDNLFEKAKPSLLAQALRFYEFNLHAVRPKRKTRSDVSKSTRKIYRQKGTGGARHGARSAPIFVGGGLAHGPSGLKRILSLPEVIKRKALSLALLDKVERNSFFLVENLSSLKKTKEASHLLSQLLAKSNIKFKNILVVLSSENKAGIKAFSNLAGVVVISWKKINAYEVFKANALILDGSIFETKKVVKKNKVGEKK